MRTVIDTSNLHEYIRSIAHFVKFSKGLRKPAFPFITISRQSCAGGHTLAEAIAKEMAKSHSSLFMGWQILDQELCRLVMEDPKLVVSMESLLTERFMPVMEDYISQIMVGTSPQIAVFHRIARIIRTFASYGKVIVVGRAGNFITRDLALGIRVRLVAQKDDRIKRMIDQFGLNRESSIKQLDEQDSSRKLLVQTYFNGKDIEDPLFYDIVFNTSAVPIPEIASFLVKEAAEKYEKIKSLLTPFPQLKEYVQPYSL